MSHVEVEASWLRGLQSPPKGYEAGEKNKVHLLAHRPTRQYPPCLYTQWTWTMSLLTPIADGQGHLRGALLFLWDLMKLQDQPSAAARAGKEKSSSHSFSPLSDLD